MRINECVFDRCLLNEILRGLWMEPAVMGLEYKNGGYRNRLYSYVPYMNVFVLCVNNTVFRLSQSVVFGAINPRLN